jgi:hypothetical protein
MKKRVLSFVVLFVLVSTVVSRFGAESFSLNKLSFWAETGMALQTEQKPPQDYMKKRLSRDTRSLGLEENKTLNMLLEQPRIKWVIRSEIKHILN